MVLDNGANWLLEDFQAWVAEDVFAGIPEVWAVIPEGNAKTTLLAGVNLYFADFKQTARCLVAAASREQAGILFDQAAGLVHRSPGFDKRFRVFEGYRRIVANATGGRVQVMAADDRTGDGAIFDLGTLDELHRQRDMRLYRTWRGKLDKRGGQLLGISTGGSPESEFEAARTQMHAQADTRAVDGAYHRSASPDAVIHDWHLERTDDLADLDLVKDTNPLKAITTDVLARKHRSATMTPAHWARFVCNLSVAEEGSWITPEAWDACAGTPLLEQDADAVVGVDIGQKKDSTAVMAVVMGADGKVHVRQRIMVPEEGRPIAITAARAALAELDDELRIIEVPYDPFKFAESAELLEERGLLMVEFPQTDTRMAPASEALYELIMDGRLVHDGDPELRSQILAAVPSETERGVRISKRKSKRRIDAAVALAMAVDRLLKNQASDEALFEVVA
jgi:phage terminase large subunit-like protein